MFCLMNLPYLNKVVESNWMAYIRGITYFSRQIGRLSREGEKERKVRGSL